MSNIVVRGEDNQEARFQWNWYTRDDTTADALSAPCWQAIDLVFKEITRSTDFPWPKKPENACLSIELSASKQHQIHEQTFGSAAAFKFVLDCLSAANSDDERESVARLVVPRSSGYIVRSDVLPLRLLGCTLVNSVVSFGKPQQFFDGKRIGIDVFPNAFAASVGGMLLKETIRKHHIHSSAGIGNGKTDLNSLLTSLDSELRNRLSFPWLSTQPPSKRRPVLAIVDGGLRGPDDGGTGGSIYTAAEALGIDMVVFDNPGHWVNGPKYRHWRKASVPLELQLEPDAGFADRIADAVRSYEGHVDGILTFRDHYKLPVAEAAQQLSLPTYPASAYAIATDKFRTSVSEGHTAYQASSAEEAVHIVQKHHLDFPLVIKPCNGFLSEGVFRVENISQLQAGAQAINTDRHGKEFVIEKYCDGPEVDADVVLCDGEVIFFEASDDFPKGADVNGHGNVKNFIELANVLPSALPEHEQTLLRDSLRQSLIRMGFQDGFFHLEARVADSSMEYATKDDVLDIRERENVDKGAAVPSVWLIEVNPRPPGIQASEAVRHTYGVDYFGLALLFALNDKHRAKQLSHAFAQGPQYWCEMVFIPVEKGGVFESGDVCEELFARRSYLADHVSSSFCFLKKGARVLDPLKTGINSWVAYFNVFSRESRAHVLELANCVRREVKFSIV